MRKVTKKALSLLTLACLGHQAQAVGLGNIEVSSKLNQPLNARIKLMSIPRQDMQNLGNIHVRLASAEAFKRAGLERPVVLSNLRFNLESSGDTSADIRISSSQPIKEPFVNFLLEVDWPNGRVLREYTVLLDPPLYKAESPAPVTAQKASTEDAVAPAPKKGTKVITSRPPTAPLPDTDVALSGQTHTVKRGESLALIANRLRKGSGLSQREMMQAIFAANPDAFINRNINMLRAGAVLQTPSGSSETTDQNAALDSVATNKTQWEDYRDQAADNTENAPVATTTAPKKAPPRPKTAAITRPLEISGASDNGSGSGAKGESGQLRQQLQEVIEENKRIQQENKNLKEDLAATKQLVEGMKQQIDALIKVQNDTLARLEQQTKGGQTAAQTVAAATPKTPDKTDPKSDVKTTDTPKTETPVKPNDWGQTDVKTDVKSVESVAKTDTPTDIKSDANTAVKTEETPVKPTDWGTTAKTEQNNGWESAPKTPEKTPVADNTKPTEDKKDDPKPADTSKAVDAPKPADKPNVTPVVNQTPPPEEGILDSVLSMASGAGTVADEAVSMVPGGWWTVGGGVGIPLLGGLGWNAYRRKRQQPDDLEEDDNDDLLQEGKDEFTDRDLENIDEGFEEIDLDNRDGLMASDEVLDEVDVYVEYERYDQALETLNHALEQRPDYEPYLFKRLEIDAAIGDTAAFEQHALPLHQTAGEHSDSWQKTQALWRKISDKPLNINAESHEGGMGIGTAAAVGLGAAGLAAAGLAAAGAFESDGEQPTEYQTDSDTELESLDMSELDSDDNANLDFSSLDASETGDMDFNLSSEETDISTLDMDSLELGEETESTSDDSMSFDQDFNLDESSSDEEMNFSLDNKETDDFNLQEKETSTDLNLDSHEEMDLSLNLDEEMGLDDLNLDDSSEMPSAIAAEPATADAALPEEDSFLLDDGNLEMGSFEEEEPVAEPVAETTDLPLDLDNEFLLDDGELQAEVSTEETPVAATVEETLGGGSEPTLDDNFIDDSNIEDFGLELSGTPVEETPLETAQTEENDFALDDSFNLDLNSEENVETNDELSLDGLTEETPLETAQAEDSDFALDDSFNLDLNSEENVETNDELSLDGLTEETPLETAQTEDSDFALDDSFNLDLNSEENVETNDELSLDGLTEETPLETAQTEDSDFALDDSFSLDLNSEENVETNDELSLDGLTEETPLETAQTEDSDFALDDSFNLDLNSEENVETNDELSLDSLTEENPLETASEDDFKLDDDFSDFDLSMNEEQPTNDLDLSLGADEQALLSDDFSLDLNEEMSDNDFNLDMDDVESKFDLVQTYLESDDLASAQSVLEDIAQSGTPEQQARAQEVLKELGV
ncbi:MAG: hypothetical protein RIT27_1913 [Pseudomonadota bacterium]